MWMYNEYTGVCSPLLTYWVIYTKRSVAGSFVQGSKYAADRRRYSGWYPRGGRGGRGGGQPQGDWVEDQGGDDQQERGAPPGRR